ncbi:MAG: hypothetical protein BKP49_03675 [Treponema sp. CETP13]|nr:MAG: hypothetical protein BKP49_03675 [Treponema sp. CETP13]
MNILYCGNDKIFDGILISLLSICKYSKAQLNVFVLTANLTDINTAYKAISQSHINFLENTIKETNSESKITLLDVSDMFREDMINSPNLVNNYTPYTLLRLYVDLIPEIPEKIIYLDTDTMAHDDIQKLYAVDVKKYEYAAALDYLGKIFLHYDYQNAGVLLFNVKKMKETGFLKNVRDYCKYKKMYFPDQTALNSVAKNKKFLSSRFNDQRKFHKDTVIQHFSKSIRWWPIYHTVNIKPWEIEKMHSVYKLHEYDDILQDYQNKKELFIREEVRNNDGN